MCQCIQPGPAALVPERKKFHSARDNVQLLLICLQVLAEFSPVADFREATCRQYEENSCSRGGFCNFMHLKPISRCALRLQQPKRVCAIMHWPLYVHIHFDDVSTLLAHQGPCWCTLPKHVDV